MRFLFTVSVLLFMVACADQRKEQKEMPMTCARQNAMLEAGYEYYWSGDHLAIRSNNGDHYRLTDQETEAQFMFDRCATSNNAGGYDYGNGYDDGSGYDNGHWHNNNPPQHNRWKQHRRNSNDRGQVRDRNNGRD
jgi:hypothetical protein